MRRSYLLYFSILTTLWLGGFISFIIYTKIYDTNNRSATDAIVVFTGGKQRIQVGLNLLKSGYAPVLFISGVGSPDSLDKIIKENGVNIAQVTYGLKATNTKQNAAEINDFVVKYNLKSIRLVTSAYHMPRAFLETRRMLPSYVTIVPHAVYTEDPNYLLLFKEYHKYLILKLVNIDLQ